MAEKRLRAAIDGDAEGARCVALAGTLVKRRHMGGALSFAVIDVAAASRCDLRACAPKAGEGGEECGESGASESKARRRVALELRAPAEAQLDYTVVTFRATWELADEAEVPGLAPTATDPAGGGDGGSDAMVAKALGPPVFRMQVAFQGELFMHDVPGAPFPAKRSGMHLGDKVLLYVGGGPLGKNTVRCWRVLQRYDAGRGYAIVDPPAPIDAIKRLVKLVDPADARADASGGGGGTGGSGGDGSTTRGVPPLCRHWVRGRCGSAPSDPPCATAVPIDVPADSKLPTAAPCGRRHYLLDTAELELARHLRSLHDERVASAKAESAAYHCVADPGTEHSAAEKAPKTERSAKFGDFLAATFGREYLQSGKGVVDVAGGKGELSMYLATEYKVPCTVIDPMVRRGRLNKHIRKKLRKSGAPEPAFIDAMLDTKLIASPQGSEVLSQASVLVGLHPDEATEPILDAALDLHKPVAIVPCCMFAQRFPDRRLDDGQPVATLSAFCDYLVQKAAKKGVTLKSHSMGFVGRDRVLYSEPADR